MMSKGRTFFKEVAGHNLERFHSECIAWVLNRIKEKEPNNTIFNKFKNNDKDGFEFVKAVAEVKQHDIVLLFKNSEDKYKYVFVENKTKSTLSRKFWKHSKNHKKEEGLFEEKNNCDDKLKKKFAQKLITDGMLQTAYYQLRWLVNENGEDYKKDILFAFSKEEENGEKMNFYGENLKKKNERSDFYENNFENPEWIILSQMKLKTFEGLYEQEENLNVTLSNLGLVLNKDNAVKDWNYLTYENLFKVEQVAGETGDFDTQIFKEYMNYARTLKDNSLDIVVEVKNALKKEHKINNILIEAGSANNSDPLMEFIIGRKDIEEGFIKKNNDYGNLEKRREEYYNLFGIKIFKNDKIFKIPLNEICYGIQLEGESLKFFFKHELYHYVGQKDKSKKEYTYKMEVLKHFGVKKEEKSSTSKTKTFFSFSEQIEIKNPDEIVKEIIKLKNRRYII